VRPITDLGDLTAPKGMAFEPGAAPQLQWLPIGELVVDDSYQRPIKGAGRRSVRRIAEQFRWSRFAPVIVSPVEGGKYAIVDGQHRVTGALLAGVKDVPCQVVVASRTEQAEAFSAINGNVTRITALALHRAAVAAGDPQANAIETAAKKAGVKILGYPKSELNQEPGETLAIGTIATRLAMHGEDTVVLALRAIVETRNRVRGGLLSAIIAAMCEVISHLPYRQDAKRVIAAFDRINLIRELSKAQTTERPRGTAIHSVLAARLRAALASQRLAA
jgi:ParB-like chromosome segregation protein Spo0J